MELCTARGVSKLPLPRPPAFDAAKHMTALLPCRTNFALIKQSRFNTGYRRILCLSSTSEETSTEATSYVKNEPESDGEITVEETPTIEKKEDYINHLNEEVPQDVSLVDNPLQLLKFLEDFDIKFDYEDKYSVFALGGGALVALWLASAVVGAIDSVPLFPKVLELVGLGYTIWFTSRYLIFKQNRDELVAQIEQIKDQVIGSKDD